MSTERISINSINAKNQHYQVRESKASTFGMNIHEKRSFDEHVKRLVRDLKNNPRLRIEPIEVTPDPKGESKYIIVDGFHRYTAYNQINKETKGARFKQIRCKVNRDVSIERALSINTEHKARGLTADQCTELDWQRFLQLMVTSPDVSIAQTAETIGISKATVSNWRKDRKTFMDAGYFNVRSPVAKNAATGLPILKQARDEAKKSTYEGSDSETEGQLCEADKKVLQTILKAVNKAKEPEKLKRGVDLLWGEMHNFVDYDLNLDESEYEDF